MRFSNITALIVLFTFLAGCATVSSRPGTAVKQSVGENDGLAYFLPRQLATVVAKRTESRLSKAVAAVSKKQEAVASAEAAVAAAEKAVDDARTDLVNSPDSDTARRILGEQLAAREAELRVARKELTAAQTGLKAATDTLRTEAAASRSGAPGAYDVTLSISLLEPSADPEHFYRLTPRHSALRDDEHKLTVSRAGLLTTSDTTASDRTADILVEVATFAGAITGGPPSKFAPRDRRPATKDKDCKLAPDEFGGIVDFADQSQVDLLNDDLQCLGVKLTVEGKRWSADSAPALAPAGRIDGIVYRTPIELLVRVEKCTLTTGACSKSGDGWYPTQIIALALPQAGPISVVRQDAGIMTRSHYGLAFDHGILTSYDASRPSEALEVARTPMRLVQGAFDGISKVISLRTGRANNLTTLTAADIALLNARANQQVAVINNQRLLSEAELNLLRAQAAQRVGVVDGQRSLSEAEFALLRAQVAQQVGAIDGQRSLAAAQLQLQSAALAGQSQLNADQLALLNAQTGLTAAQLGAPAQVSTAELNAMVTLLRNQARRDAITRCVEQQIAAVAPPATPSIDICLASP